MIARAPGFLAWMTRDAALIALARGMRTFGQGAVVVLLAIYLDVLGFSVIQIGLFISASLAGGALFTLVVVVAADAFGRRRLLVFFSLMTSAAALTVVATESFAVLLLASFLGSFAVAGGAAGGAVAPLEQATLAGTVAEERRTDLYAFYGIVGTGASALGALAAGLPAFYQAGFGMSEPGAFRIVFATLAVLTALAAVCYALLTPAVEAGGGGRRGWVSPFRLRSRRLIFTLSGLFSVDHFAGGLIPQSLVALWFFTRFGVELESIAFIFFGTRLLAAISLWVAARLANRIGLINTMVWTHIPSSLLLIAIPFLPNVWLAAAFWLVRGFFGQMDVPTRQSYTMAVVGPDERSAMAGINSVSRSVTGTASPSIATALWSIGFAGIPFVSCGVLKIAYDLSLYFMFRHVRTPEEARRREATRQPGAPAPRGS